MDELIRRADALNAISQYCVGCNSHNGMRCRSCKIGGAIDAAENCKAVDAEPVRHGKWIWDENGMDWNIGAWVCSECGMRNENIHSDMEFNPHIWAGTKYCPNCGARMDGGERDG